RPYCEADRRHRRRRHDHGHDERHMTDSSRTVPGTDAPRTAASPPPGRTPGQSSPPVRRRRRMSRRARRDALVFLAFAAPNLVLIAMFTYRPLILNIQYSMLDWTL